MLRDIILIITDLSFVGIAIVDILLLMGVAACWQFLLWVSSLFIRSIRWMELLSYFRLTIFCGGFFGDFSNISGNRYDGLIVLVDGHFLICISLVRLIIFFYSHSISYSIPWRLFSMNVKGWTIPSIDISMPHFVFQ